MLVILLVLLFSKAVVVLGTAKSQYTNEWAVELNDHVSHEDVDTLADNFGFSNFGKVDTTVNSCESANYYS